jgi:hypothetical protein
MPGRSGTWIFSHIFSLIFPHILTVGSPGLSLMFHSFNRTKKVQNTERCPLGFPAVALYPSTVQKKYRKIKKCESLNFKFSLSHI